MRITGPGSMAAVEGPRLHVELDPSIPAGPPRSQADLRGKRGEESLPAPTSPTTAPLDLIRYFAGPKLAGVSIR